MNTITSKELRYSLNEVVQSALRGEETQVTYRSKPVFKIVPIKSGKNALRPGSGEAMRQFGELVKSAQNIRAMSEADNLKSWKQLAAEHYGAKYGVDPR
jgi:prevent-host-death family protein